MDDIWLLVLGDMANRRSLGITRYGKPVTGDNSEDWLQHAYEEALDLAVYLRAEIERRKRKRPRGDADPDGMASRGGKARSANMTPEQRSECAKKAAEARWNGTRKKTTQAAP